MAINLAEKYAAGLAKKYALQSVIKPIANNKDYSWEGVATVNVLTAANAVLDDYDRGAANNRYGTPSEVQDTKQTMKISQDKSFTNTIDKGNYSSQMMAKKANEWLSDQVKEVVIPAFDQYCLAALAGAATSNSATATEAITETNAYKAFLAGTKWMTNHKVPKKGLVAWASPDLVTSLVLDGKFNLSSEKGMEQNINGFVGKVAGVKVIEVPTDYLPSDTNYIMADPKVLITPEKLHELHIHKDAPGISGWLIEFRTLYDAFILDAKKDGVFIHKSA